MMKTKDEMVVLSTEELLSLRKEPTSFERKRQNLERSRMAVRLGFRAFKEHFKVKFSSSLLSLFTAVYEELPQVNVVALIGELIGPENEKTAGQLHSAEKRDREWRLERAARRQEIEYDLDKKRLEALRARLNKHLQAVRNGDLPDDLTSDEKEWQALPCAYERGEIVLYYQATGLRPPKRSRSRGMYKLPLCLGPMTRDRTRISTTKKSPADITVEEFRTYQAIFVKLFGPLSSASLTL